MFNYIDTIIFNFLLHSKISIITHSILVIIYSYSSIIIWLLISWSIIAFISWLMKYLNWKIRIKYRKTVIFLFFLIPFMEFFGSYFYRINTFPKVCHQLAGYRTDTPIKMTSFLNKYNPLELLFIENVEYTEFEYQYPPGGWMKATGFPLGRYRYKFYPNGTKECDFPLSNSHMLKNKIKNSGKFYSKLGLKLKIVDTNKKCLGVTKIDEFTAQYTISNKSDINQPSGYGYPIYIKSYELLDREQNIVISQYKSLSVATKIPAILSMYPLNNGLACLNDFVVARKQRGRIEKNPFDSHIAILSGFFTFEEPD